MIRYLLIGLLGYLFIGLFLPIANGQTMSNENYKIKMQEFSFITKEDYFQTQRYLQAANIKLGLIVNFRSTFLKPKRVINTKYDEKK